MEIGMKALALLSGTRGEKTVGTWRGLASPSLLTRIRRKPTTARTQRIDPVADAFARWKRRLENLLAGSPDEHLDIGRVAADHHCALGAWLHGTARRELAALPEYHALHRSHIDFHLMVSDVVREAYAGNTVLAHGIIGDFFNLHAERVQTSYSMLTTNRKRALCLHRLPGSGGLICCA